MAMAEDVPALQAMKPGGKAHRSTGFSTTAIR
jgi:hypothetical protein